MKNDLSLSQQVCFPVYLLSKEITNLYRPILKKLDLTYSQYLVMLILWNTKKQTVTQLGDKLSLDSGTLTPLLKRLERKELIKRNRSALDERMLEISLTQKGKHIKEKATCIPKQLMESMHVTKEELVLLKGLITKILDKNNS